MELQEVVLADSTRILSLNQSE